MKTFFPVITTLAVAFASAALAKPAAPVSSKHDNHAPIEITSDTLEVFQNESKAVFSGHVVAIQEEMRLKADTMTVYYRKPAETPGGKGAKPEATAEAPKEAASPLGLGGGQKDAIRKIEAEGHVFMSTPMETASGAKGIYDVPAQMLYLNDNVVLTRDKNVLKGDQLTYNFTTGQSSLKSKNAASEKTGPRVRALFVPEDAKQAGKGK